MADWIDVTQTVHEGMEIFPGQERFRRVWDMRSETQRCSLSHFVISSHCGTHLDAPAHFVAGGATVEQAPLTLLIGRARVVTVRDGQELRETPDSVERLLIRSEGYQGLSLEDAACVLNKNVALVGIDRACVARTELDTPVHRRLLEKGVWVLESLELANVSDGDYELVCLPLKVAGGEGAPARVALRPCGFGGGASGAENGGKMARLTMMARA